MATQQSSHLGLVTIIVESYDAAIDFFTTKLGFELIEDSPATKNSGEAKRWVVIQQPGQNVHTDTGILLAQADGPEQRAAIGKQWAGRVGLFLYVEDFDLEFSRMREAAVDFITEPKEEPYGKLAVFRMFLAYELWCRWFEFQV